MPFWKSGHRTLVVSQGVPDLHEFICGMAGSCQAKNPQPFPDTGHGGYSAGLCR